MSCVCLRQLASGDGIGQVLLASSGAGHTFKTPSNLLDPKVIPFIAFLALPVFRGARAECQAVTAKPERGRVPRPQ